MGKELVKQRHETIARYEALVRDIAALVSYKSLLHPRSRRPLEERMQVLREGCQESGNAILKQLPPDVAEGIDFSALGINKVVTRPHAQGEKNGTDGKILQLWELDEYAARLVADFFPHIPTFTNPQTTSEPLSPIPEG